MPKKNDKPKAEQVQQTSSTKSFGRKEKKVSVLSGDLKKEGVVAEENSFLDPEEHKETSEQLSEEMDLGEVDEDVYTEEGREKETEDDEISAEEEGFMAGAEGKGRKKPVHHH